MSEEELKNQRECLEYMVNSSIMRFTDLKLLGEVLGQLRVSERGFNTAINLVNKIKERKSDDL